MIADEPSTGNKAQSQVIITCYVVNGCQSTLTMSQHES